MYHCQQRAIQRYNKEFTKKDIKEIEKLIRQGLYLQANDEVIKGRNIVFVRYKHIPIKVCYDSVKKYIVTILPFIVEEYNEIISIR